MRRLILTLSVVFWPQVWLFLLRCSPRRRQPVAEAMTRMKVREALRSTGAWARACAPARIGILALCALLLALVADPRSALADAAVTPASGGTELVVGTSAPLSGPYIK